MEKAKKEYYKLPTDSYGQPNGYVVPIMMTEEEYNIRKVREYIYDNYKAALRRGKRLAPPWDSPAQQDSPRGQEAKMQKFYYVSWSPTWGEATYSVCLYSKAEQDNYLTKIEGSAKSVSTWVNEF